MEQKPPRINAATREQIDDDIADACFADRAITDAAAKHIAQAIHPGSGALYELAMTGELTEGVHVELDIAREIAPEQERWVAALDQYCLSRLDSSPVPGWQELGSDQNST